MFLRGTGTHGTANMAKGTDFSAPAVGTIENDQMQDHKHQTIMSPGTSYQTYSSYAIGNSSYNTTYNFNTTAPQEINSQGTPRTGDETRPVNAAVLYIIKNYTYEAGVRKLKERVLEIIRQINLPQIKCLVIICTSHI